MKIIASNITKSNSIGASANKTARINIGVYYPPRGLYESMEPREEEEP